MLFAILADPIAEEAQNQKASEREHERQPREHLDREDARQTRSE
jgi:hypothetical protein